MYIVVLELQNGHELRLQVDPLDHVSVVKEKVQLLLGFPVHRQILSFNNTELIDTIELEFFGIKENSRISLGINSEENRFTIRLIIVTSEVFMEVEEMDYVVMLRRKIYQDIGAPTGQQIVLYHKGKVMVNHRRLCKYALGMNSEIIVSFKPMTHSRP